ncbi:MAG: CoA pyrophosphatase [Mogibacterium sp.]|nr:CoA pyrophosphatase [Mogibacterium sp.]
MTEETTQQTTMSRPDRRSAVLVSLVDTEAAGLCFLMEVRSLSVRQPGEVCFPGGRMEPGETPEETALRETEEELGSPADRVAVCCRLEEEQLLNKTRVVPVLGLIDAEALDHIVLSEKEVTEVFLLPVGWVREHEPAYYDLDTLDPLTAPNKLLHYLASYGPENRARGKVWYWEYLGYAVWGMTARIIRKVIGTDLPERCAGGAEGGRP